MHVRNTQIGIFQQVKRGIDAGYARLFAAQRQVATGRRILAPSDDPVGAALALSLRGRQADVGRMLDTIGVIRPGMQAASSALEESAGLLGEARALLIEGLNGTLQANDRLTLAEQVEELRGRMLEIANSKAGAGFLFGGSESDAPPYLEQGQGGQDRVVYQGNDEELRAQVGFGVEIGINVPGSSVFGGGDGLGATMVGDTGAALGTSANQGQGFVKLALRHDATTGSLPAGIAFAGAGAADTFVGERTLVVDGTAGTVRFGDGEAVPIPGAGDPDVADFVLTDAAGAELHLDFSAWAGASATTTVSGLASASIDGGETFVELDLAATDQRLVDAAGGTVLHVDATGVRRTGTDLVNFAGSSDVFAVLDGIVEDLRNVDGVDLAELGQRMGQRLNELDRRHEAVIVTLGSLGARLERLEGSQARLQDVDLFLETRRSEVEDADLTELVLEITRSQQSLELAQATGSRLIQNSLLDFLS